MSSVSSANLGKVLIVCGLINRHLELDKKFTGHTQ